MSLRKEKARPGTAIPGRAVENGTACETAHASTKNDTISAADSQTFRVSDLLLSGAENAVSRRDLMSMTGMSDRELRLMIESGRRQGIPILSDCIHGYFLPGDSSERDRCVKSMRHRAGEILRSAAAIEKAVVR